MHLLPTSTDAPIYHRPIGTALVCLTNVWVFFTESDRFWTIPAHPDMLTFGQGYHPTQWITSTFLHAGPLHLVGNLYFLWLFAYVIEGKVGWWRFLLIYVGIAAIEGLVVQTLMLDAQGGGAIGASGVIFGLAAICAIWAPMNEFECMFFAFGFHHIPVRPSTVHVPIAVFCCGWIIWEFLASAILWRHAMSSELLHVIGAIAGFPIGLIMLQMKWVDCDNWDVISVIQGKHQTKETFHKQDASDLTNSDRDERADFARKRQKQIRKMIRAEEWTFAYGAWSQATKEDAQFQLPPQDLHRMICIFRDAKDHQQTVELSKNFLQHYPDQGHSVRLALASSLLATRSQPALAHRLLLEIRDLDLSSEERVQWKRMIRSAAARKQSADLELVD